MSGAPVLELRDVSKRYALGERAPYDTLREAIARAATRRGEARAADEVWALRDLTLDVAAGESVGIIGRNGAGKTTLLRIIARITHPTVGLARIRGGVGALLEVGTGFHPELTGRENVTINGALLGLSRAQVRERFDAIVEFAGVERFLDTPLKRWSTGMQLRLAFAVGAHLAPAILAVDEVLAVGDAEFQQRCLGRLSDVHDEGRAVLFVSHDLGAVARLCDRAIWIDEGRVRADGPAQQVIERYLAESLGAGDSGSSDLFKRAAGPVRLESLSVTDSEGAAPPRRDRELDVRLRFEVAEPVSDLDVALWIATASGERLVDDAWSDRRAGPLRMVPGERYEARVTLPAILRPGDHVVGAWIGTEGTQIRFFDGELGRFTVAPLVGDRAEAIRRPRLIVPPVRWEVSRRA